MRISEGGSESGRNGEGRGGYRRSGGGACPPSKTPLIASTNEEGEDDAAHARDEREGREGGVANLVPHRRLAEDAAVSRVCNEAKNYADEGKKVLRLRNRPNMYSHARVAVWTGPGSIFWRIDEN